MELKDGTLLQGGKYRIVHKLGQGGFGISYLALQSGLNRKVAIKEFFILKQTQRLADGRNIVNPTPEAQDFFSTFLKKFIKEARTVARLEHPGIIPIHDIFSENGTAYYVMEYIEGGSLQDAVICRKKPFAEDEAIGIIRKVAVALDYVHSQNVLHLDLKPDNIMMRPSGEPVLIDFGISKHYDKAGRQTTNTLGGYTPGFSPIEQYDANAMGTFSPAVDVYSLGATLFYLLTGELPPEPMALMQKGFPGMGNRVSGHTVTLLKKAMSVQPENRMQTMAGFLELPAEESSPAAVADPVREPVADDRMTYPRALIERLAESKEYKEAYRMCLANISRGFDVDYSESKSVELMEIIKRGKPKDIMFEVLLVAFCALVGITLFILYILISK
ncbi:MAG: serine/threonine protein kinase [Muribaculaceae bacterium]|nr:serine/threonine protein kinase [Muribaculaceae bacterium]